MAFHYLHCTGFSFYNMQADKRFCRIFCPSFLSKQQQLGKKDRLLQQQQQKRDESQHKAHEVSHGRVRSKMWLKYYNTIIHISMRINVTMIREHFSKLSCFAHDRALTSSYHKNKSLDRSKALMHLNSSMLESKAIFIHTTHHCRLYRSVLTVE